MFKKYGIGQNLIQLFLEEYGLNKKFIRNKFPNSKFEKFFSFYVRKKMCGRELFDYNRANLSFLKNIKSYRGLRHKNNYPVRGQRTHTNAKKKIFKFPKI